MATANFTELHNGQAKALSHDAMCELIEYVDMVGDNDEARSLLAEHVENTIPLLVIDVIDSQAVKAGASSVTFRLNDRLSAMLNCLRAGGSTAMVNGNN